MKSKSNYFHVTPINHFNSNINRILIKRERCLVSFIRLNFHKPLSTIPSTSTQIGGHQAYTICVMSCVLWSKLHNLRESWQSCEWLKSDARDHGQRRAFYLQVAVRDPASQHEANASLSRVLISRFQSWATVSFSEGLWSTELSTYVREPTWSQAIATVSLLYFQSLMQTYNWILIAVSLRISEADK